MTKDNMDAGVVVQNDPKQNDKASLAGEGPKQNRPPMITKTNDPASNGKTLAQPFIFPDLYDTPSKDQPITINDQVVKTLSHGISIAGTTLTPGAPPIHISGTPISYGPSLLLAVGSTTTSLAVNDPTPTTMSIASQVFTIKQNAVGIAGATLTPEAPAVTVSGTPISLGSNALVIGTNTITLNQPRPADPFITYVASYPITAAPDAVEVAETTLHPGDPGVKIDGTVVSLDVGGHLVLGSKTIALTASEGSIFGDPAGADDTADPFVTTIDDQAITAAPTVVAFRGTTLTPGAPGRTIGGTLISLNPAGQLVVGSTTVTLARSSTSIDGAELGESGDQSNITTIIHIGDQPITAEPTAVAFSGTTLTPGSPGKTISGTLISLNTAGQLIIGTNTVPLETSSVGLGRLIMEGFGARGPLIGSGTSPLPSIAGNSSWNATSSNRTTTNADVAIFRGEAENLRRGSNGGLFWEAATVAAVGIWISSRFG